MGVRDYQRKGLVVGLSKWILSSGYNEETRSERRIPEGQSEGHFRFQELDPDIVGGTTSIVEGGRRTQGTRPSRTGETRRNLLISADVGGLCSENQREKGRV